MELRTAYKSRQAACDAIAGCTAKPGDVVVWDAGTSSQPSLHPELWPALLVSLTVTNLSGDCHAVHALVTIPGDVRTRRVNARFIRLPKRARNAAETHSQQQPAVHDA